MGTEPEDTPKTTSTGFDGFVERARIAIKNPVAHNLMYANAVDRWVKPAHEKGLVAVEGPETPRAKAL